MDSDRYRIDLLGGTALVMNNNLGLLDPPDKGPDKAKWEREHFLEKTYQTPAGALCIPADAIRKAFIVACKFVVGVKPKGTAFKTFGPVVEAAMVVEDDAVLDQPVSALVAWPKIVNLDPSKGPKGPRGPRFRPLLPTPWAAATNLRTFDKALSREVLQQIAEAAGWKCGLLDARAIGFGRCDIRVTAV